MKKIIFSLALIALLSLNLFGWEIYLKPPVDSSGRINYGIACNNGDRIIVTYNTTQSYKPYYVNSHTFKTLNESASYACSSKKNRTITIKKGSIFCDIEHPIKEIAKSEMKRLGSLMSPTKEMQKHCLTIRKDVQAEIIKHFQPDTYEREFYDSGKNKRWTETTKYKYSYYKITDGREIFYVLDRAIK